MFKRLFDGAKNLIARIKGSKKASTSGKDANKEKGITATKTAAEVSEQRSRCYPNPIFNPTRSQRVKNKIRRRQNAS